MMGILREHFNRVRRMAALNLPVTDGVYVDVGNTLIGFQVNRPLVEFLQWNNTHGLLGKNHVFTSDITHSRELITQENFDLASIGVDALQPKYAAYNEAFNKQHQHNLAVIAGYSAEEKITFIGQPAHALALVIDDMPHHKQGIKGAAMALTTWDPYDDAVKDFLARKEYLAFQP